MMISDWILGLYSPVVIKSASEMLVVFEISIEVMVS